MPQSLTLKNTTFFIVLMLQATTMVAQPGKLASPKTQGTKVDTAKATFTSTFGMYTDGSKAFASDIKRLLTVNPQVKVKDNKGVVYTVVSFELMWKKKEQSMDIKTGKPKTVSTMVGGDIKGNLITDAWKEEINGYLQKGEELSFGTILYFDPKRKVNVKAPSIVITVL